MFTSSVSVQGCNGSAAGGLAWRWPLGVVWSVPFVSLTVLELRRELSLRQRKAWGLLQLSMYGGFGDGGESLTMATSPDAVYFPGSIVVPLLLPLCIVFRGENPDLGSGDGGACGVALLVGGIALEARDLSRWGSWLSW